MPERENTCCFTGHREYKLPWGSDENDPRCRKLQQQLFDAVDAVYAAGIRHFICGMANGCDLYFFDAARYLRLQHPEVTIEAAIPYSGQADRWRPELRHYRPSLQLWLQQPSLHRQVLSHLVGNQ